MDSINLNQIQTHLTQKEEKKNSTRVKANTIRVITWKVLKLCLWCARSRVPGYCRSGCVFCALCLAILLPLDVSITSIGLRYQNALISISAYLDCRVCAVSRNAWWIKIYSVKYKFLLHSPSWSSPDFEYSLFESVVHTRIQHILRQIC